MTIAMGADYRVRLGRSALGGALAVVLLTGTVVIGALPRHVSAPAEHDPATAEPKTPDAAAADEQAAKAAFADLPMRFEPNQGQADPAVRFVGRGDQSTLYLGADQAVLSLPVPSRLAGPGIAPSREQLTMKLVGADRAAPAQGTQLLPGVSNYLIGDDPAGWHVGVPTFGGVRYAAAYPGIDVDYHGSDSGSGLEYDFYVAPGADPSAIRLSFEGTQPRIDSAGDLVLRAGEAEVRHHKPVLFQDIEGKRRPVEGSFDLRPDGLVGFRVGPYDQGHELVIDPVVAYSTYFGGSNSTAGGGGEFSTGLALDASGMAYITGSTNSLSNPGPFPTLNAFDSTQNGGASDAFVAKFNTGLSGNASLLYSTFLGGSGSENLNDAYTPRIAVDASGIYVSGYTNSTNFPLLNAYDTVCGVGASCDGTDDGFLTKLNTAGSALLYSTYLGGSSSDKIRGLGVDSTGKILVGGSTSSNNFPVLNAAQGTYGGAEDGFVAQIDPAAPGGGPSLLYSTYLGGSASDSVIDLAVAGNEAYVVGTTGSANLPTANPYDPSSNGGFDAFVARVNPSLGASLVFSTYLGGTAGEGGSAITATSAGLAYVTGNTDSSDFPMSGAYDGTRNGTDAFISRLDTGNATLTYSTFFGGSNTETGYSVALDAGGKIYVAGTTMSTDFLSTNGVENPPVNGNAAAFLTRFATTTTVDYSTYLAGGDGVAFRVVPDTAADPNALVTGVTYSTSMSTPNGYDTTCSGCTSGSDSFLTKINPTGTTPLPPVVSSVTPNTGPFSGATPITITGSNFTGATAVNFGANVATNVVIVNSNLITATSPCLGACANASLSASKVDVSVTTAHGTSAADPENAVFTYGEGANVTGGACSGCPTETAVPLPNGKVLTMRTGVVVFIGVGSTTNGSPTFTTSSPTFSASDVGRRIGGAHVPAGTTILVFNSSTSVTMSQNATGTVSSSFLRMSTSDVRIFDPASGAWAATGSCHLCGSSEPQGGGGHASATVFPASGACGANCGKVLVAGGNDPVTSATRAVKDAFLYDPAVGTWTATAALDSCGAPSCVARKGHTATLLPNGKVLVAGGNDTGNLVSDTLPAPDPKFVAQLYDPAAGTWSAAGSMTGARTDATAVLLPSTLCSPNCGKVLVAGGSGTLINATANQPEAVATAELYDPATNLFTTTGSMATKRAQVGSAALPTTGSCGSNCGKVLVAGGKTTYSGAHNTAELFSPTAGTWAATGAMSETRGAPVTTLLPSGKVVVRADTATAELYSPAAGTWASGGKGLNGVTSNNGIIGNLVLDGPTTVCRSRCGQVLYLTPAGAEFYVPRPSLTGVIPTIDCTTAGSAIHLTGTGLNSATAVKFAGTATAGALTPDPAAPSSVLRAVRSATPPAAPGSQTVTVVTYGGESDPSAAITTTAGVLCQPRNVSATPAAASALVTWSPPTVATGLTGYTITTNAPAGVTPPAPVNVASTVLGTTIAGLTNGVGYTFTVAATNASGNGPGATAFTATPLATLVVPAGANARVNAERGNGSATAYNVMVALARAYNGSEGCAQYAPAFPNLEIQDAVSPQIGPNNQCRPVAHQAANTVQTENYDHDLMFNWAPQGSENGRAILCNQVPDSIKPPLQQLAAWTRTSSGPPATTDGFSGNPCRFAPPTGSGINVNTSGAVSGLTLRWVAYARDAVTHTTFPGGNGSSLTPAFNDGAGTGPNLTFAVIQGIWSTCSVKDWRQIDNATGGLSGFVLPAGYDPYAHPETAADNPAFPANGGQPIVMWTAPPGSGSRNSWDGFLAGATSDSCLPAHLKDADPDNGSRVVTENLMASVTNSADVNGPNDPCTGLGNPVGWTPPPGTPACTGSTTNPAVGYAANEGNSIFYMSPGLFRTDAATGQNARLGQVDGLYPTLANVQPPTGGFRFARTIYNVYRQSCRDAVTLAQTTNANLCANIPTTSVKPVLASTTGRQFFGNAGWICKGRNAHSRLPGTFAGNDNLGVVTTGASRNYGANVIATIRAAGMIELRDPAGGTNICDIADRLVP